MNPCPEYRIQVQIISSSPKYFEQWLLLELELEPFSLLSVADSTDPTHLVGFSKRGYKPDLSLAQKFKALLWFAMTLKKSTWNPFLVLNNLQLIICKWWITLGPINGESVHKGFSWQIPARYVLFEHHLYQVNRFQEAIFVPWLLNCLIPGVFLKFCSILGRVCLAIIFLLKSIVRFSFEIDCQFRNNSVRKIFFANKNPGLCRKWWRQRAILIYQWIRSPVIPFFWMERLLMKYHGKTEEKNSEFAADIWEKIKSNFNSNWASILYPWIVSNSSTSSPVSPSSSDGYPNKADPNWEARRRKTGPVRRR